MAFYYQYMLNKKFWALSLGTSIILLISVFAFWPIMGHDYSFVVPELIDLKVAWEKFGVLNPHFSPIKCLGTPVWARPVGFSLSLLHFLTILTNELIGLVLFIVIVSLTSFWGAYRLSLRMRNTEKISLYLAAGWTLQGWMIMRASVGHIMYISVGWFPLILYLLLKQKSKWRDCLATLSAGILISQFIYLGAPYAPFMLIMSLAFLLPLIRYWKQEHLIEWKNFLLKLVFSGVIAGIIVLPKVIAVSELMQSFPRIHPLSKIGFRALPYSVLNLFSFFPHDYRSMVKWWYGNWESVQFMFPLLLLSLIYFLIVLKEKKTLIRLLVTINYLIFVSFVFSSGVLSGLFSILPYFKSMHVNPRWNIVIALPVFFLMGTLLTRENFIPKTWFRGLFCLVYLIPFFHLSVKNLNMNYMSHAGYNPEANRMNYCYEPIFGYNMESFPLKSRLGDLNFEKEEYLDPRCYLPSGKCRPGTLLKASDKKSLETYQLR